MTENRPGEVQSGVMSMRNETLISAAEKIDELRKYHKYLQNQSDALDEQFARMSDENDSRIEAIAIKQKEIQRDIRAEKRKAIVEGGLLKTARWEFVEIDRSDFLTLGVFDPKKLSKELYTNTPNRDCPFRLDDARNVVLIVKKMLFESRIESIRLKFNVANGTDLLFEWIDRLGLQIDGEGLDRATKEAYRRGDLLSALLRKHGCIVSDVVAPTE